MQLKDILAALLGAFGVALIGFSLLPSDQKTRHPAGITGTVPDPQRASLIKVSSLGTPALAEPEVKAKPARNLQKIYSLLKCYQERSCAFPQTDPKSYEIALGHAIHAAMLTLWADSQSDASARVEVTQLARTLVKNPDPYVQDACLRIFSAQPPNTENLVAAVEGLHGSPDPLLVSQLMSEFARYLGSSEENMIHGFLAELIATGGQFASEVAAQNILPFINERSLSIYKLKLRHMNSDAKSYTYLENALTEYDRLKSGG